VKTPRIDLRADLNAEDDDGLLWSLLRDARDQALIYPGSVLIAGVEGFWSVVRIVAVDDDGQVHFEKLPDDDPASQVVLSGARRG
jgi:hypothetical protein